VDGRITVARQLEDGKHAYALQGDFSIQLLKMRDECPVGHS
jgi:hypothetical protein